MVRGRDCGVREDVAANTKGHFLKLQEKISSLLCILLYITEKNRVPGARGSSFARVCCMHICCCMCNQVCLWCLLAGIFLHYLSFWERVGPYKSGPASPWEAVPHQCWNSQGVSGILCGCWGSTLRYSCLHRENFTPPASHLPRTCLNCLCGWGWPCIPDPVPLSFKC